VRVLDPGTNDQLALKASWRRNRTLTYGLTMPSYASKSSVQRHVCHTKILREIFQGSSSYQKFQQSLHVSCRKLSYSHVCVYIGSNFFDSLVISTLFSEFQSLSPARVPYAVSTPPQPFRTHRYHRLTGRCEEIHIFDSFGDGCGLPVRTSRHVALTDRCTQFLRTHRHRSTGGAKTQSFRTQRLLASTNGIHFLFDRNSRPSSFAKFAVLFVRESILLPGLSAVVPTRFIAVEFCGPLTLGFIGSGLTENHVKNIVTKVFCSKSLNSATEHGFLTLLMTPPSHHGSFSHVRESTFDVSKRVHRLPHVLFPIRRPLSATTRVGVARVDVDGEPPLLRVSAQLPHLATPLRLLDTEPKRLHTLHRSPPGTFGRGGPRCPSARTLRVALPLAQEAA